MDINEKIYILDEKIIVLQGHISSILDAINEGAVSNKENSLEDSVNDLIKRKEALEQYRDLLTATI